MTDNHSNKNKDEEGLGIKIVLAGTIASGKTTLLGALSIYNEGIGDKGVRVGPYYPAGIDPENYQKSLKFRADATNCFNNTPESRCLSHNPWPGATRPDEIPKEIWLEIAFQGEKHRLSFFDFAGETFLDAFDTFYNDHQKGDTEQEKMRRREQAQESVKNKVGHKFNVAIADASIVLIVVSCKDIIDFQGLLQHERDYAERMQFAYSFMLSRAEELRRTADREVRVLLVITQCDQYKALLSSNTELFENGLESLLADVPCSQIERIFTSSAYQTELKKVTVTDAKSQILKFCPVSKMHRRSDQPCSLGIEKLVDHICDVSSRVKAEYKTAQADVENRIKREWMRLKMALDNLESNANSSMDEARRIIGNNGSEFTLSPHVRQVELALQSYYKARDAANEKGYCSTPSEDAVKALGGLLLRVEPDIVHWVGILDAALKTTRRA